jgi:hypothetical protein
LALTHGLILLPLDQELDDFPLRMIKVLQTLEIAEQRSQLEILGDFTKKKAGVQEFRRVQNLELS